MVSYGAKLQIRLNLFKFKSLHNKHTFSKRNNSMFKILTKLLALLPHSKRAVGSIPGHGGPSVWSSVHVLPLAAWVPSPASSHSPKTCSC